MPQAVYIVFGALYTVACVAALGKLLLRSLGVRLNRAEDHLLGFVAGAPLLSLLVFAACALGLARKGLFIWLGVAILALAWRRGVYQPLADSLPPLPRLWKGILIAVFAIFGTLYLVNAMAPEWSPDGASYHLGLVARYLREHRFTLVPTNMYANLSQGVEMLYLFAFAFGRHSSAALVHCAFLFALPLLMLSYARRFGIPSAGACGAVLVFASPLVGIDGTSAYNDVAVATVVFAVYYLLRIWESERDDRLLVPIGLVAGFAYAVKYTAAVAIPCALGFVIWKGRTRRAPYLRALVVISGCALLMMLPWMLKNWLWVGNPFSPFANALFPNPYVTVGFEREYAEWLRHYDLGSFWKWPAAVTVRGELSGVFGPVFLLAPLGLFALRSPHGRLLVGAGALACLPYFGNIGARFLLPALPFFSLAMGLVASERRFAAPALALLHAVLSWPSVAVLYTLTGAWQLSNIPWRGALRITPEEAYLESRRPDFAIVSALNRVAPADAKVFVFRSIAEAYTTREIVVSHQSASGWVMFDALAAAVDPGRQPTGRLRFEFPRESLRGVRVIQTALGQRDQWIVAEMRVLRSGAELPRSPQWRLRSRPNPWYAQLAFDNSPVTAWTSADIVAPGMYLELDFGRAETLDAVVVETRGQQGEIQLRLDGLDASGRWKELAAQPRFGEGSLPAGLRRAATEELKARGIRYMVIFDDDWQATDFMMNSYQWGIRQLAELNRARLYEIL
jgi:hypothetical protein